MDREQTKRCLANLDDELNGAALYDALAQAEEDARLAEIYRRFAATERRHAQTWTDKLIAAGESVPAFKPSWRTRTLSLLARKIGVWLVLPTIRGIEQSGAGGYQQQAGAETMAAEEASHSRILQQMTSRGGGIEGAHLARIEGRHRSGGNALRAAVLGANDGLVSNLSLVMGVAGAQSGTDLGGNVVLVTGLAGLLAGACSMALGEWLSVQSSREMYQRQIEIEAEEIETSPEDEAEELSLIYQSRGLAAQQAGELARQIMSNKESALATLAREELGIVPEELGGSAYVAAGTSFALFAIGAIVPVIAFMFMRGQSAVALSSILSTIALYAIGSATSLFTGRPAWRSGLRMVIFGLAAAGLTYGIGRLIGVSIG